MEGVAHSVPVPRLVSFCDGHTRCSSPGALRSFQLRYTLAYIFAYTYAYGIIYNSITNGIFHILKLFPQVCDICSQSQIRSRCKSPAELIDSAKGQADARGMDCPLIFKGTNDLCAAVWHVGSPPSSLHFAGAHLQCGPVNNIPVPSLPPQPQDVHT